jgi:hypothetical protein
MSKSAQESNRALTDPDYILEHCEECGGERPHTVSIEILQESTDEHKAEYSREPYRVSVCEECETTERLRMNNQ